jgi:hypothetical protein
MSSTPATSYCIQFCDCIPLSLALYLRSIHSRPECLMGRQRDVVKAYIQTCSTARFQIGAIEPGRDRPGRQKVGSDYEPRSRLILKEGWAMAHLGTSFLDIWCRYERRAIHYRSLLIECDRSFLTGI